VRRQLHAFRASDTRADTVMSTAAIITFVVIAGLVWGGFAFIIATAVRKESRKADRG
jgi:hypothetical protein